MSHFQHHKMLRSKCSIALAPSFKWKSNVLIKFSVIWHYIHIVILVICIAMFCLHLVSNFTYIDLMYPSFWHAALRQWLSGARGFEATCDPGRPFSNKTVAWSQIPDKRRPHLYCRKNLNIRMVLAYTKSSVFVNAKQ